jgi:Zn-dependent peptidase ImmA (M78 family)
MRTTSQEVSVAAGILRWARETIGKSIEDVSRRLDTSTALIAKWENGDKNPTLKQLKELATFYKRPLAVFFLPSPPEEDPLPADFRTLPASKKRQFSDKTLLALRRARRIQSLTEDLNKSIKNELCLRIGYAALSDDPRELATQVRGKLKITADIQFGWKDSITALNEWKHSIEECGTLVFELPFPMDDGRAFSFADADQPIIVLNSHDAINGRIFSLFHEYGHLLIGHSGICDLNEESKYEEQFCNQFAGELLVPRVTISHLTAVQTHATQMKWDDNVLQQIAEQFKVSCEVILRRLLSLGQTTETFYKEKRDEWNKLQPKPRRGRSKPDKQAKQCIRQNGIPFTSLVLESAHLEKITYRDISDYLAISLKHLPLVESLVREEKIRYG